ncbi:MAG: hypothetical protein EXS31_16860 [Pedosphaera sp.]|nr:hypothetical protein [Pedosphaera sp.]
MLPPQSLTVLATSSNPGLIPNPTVSYTSPNTTATLQITPAPNAFGPATITVHVNDNGGTAGGGINTTSRSFQVTVNGVNDAPSISVISNQTITMNGVSGPLSFTVGDVETPAGGLGVVAFGSSNNALVPPANIVFGGIFANRTITVTPAANQTGVTMISFSVADPGDGGGVNVRTTTRTFNLTVNPLVLSASWYPLIAPGWPIVGVAATPGSATSAIATPGTVLGANNYPGTQSPDKAIDGNPGSKYQNFSETNAGLILTIPGAAAASGFRFATADDSPERDPLTITIEGTSASDPTTAAAAATWTQIYSGPSGLLANPGRVTQGPIVWFSNQAIFNTYRVLVTSVRDGAAANSVQFGEFQMFSITSPVLVGGGLRRELFLNVTGGDVASLTSSPNYPASPNSVSIINAAEAPSSIGDSYGQRIRGYLLAPAIGNYTFYISSDDQSQLFLSPDANPANKVQIATEPQWNGFRQWITGDNQAARGNPASNISSPIPLQEGGVYYIEILHKEGGGGDNAGVTWQLPGTPAPVNGAPPIPGQYLALDGSLPLAPTISAIGSQSTSVNVATSDIAFTVGDVQTAPSLLTVTGISSNPTLVPNLPGNITLGGSGPSRTVKITPAPNQMGTATITLTVTDGGGLTSSISFTVAVGEVLFTDNFNVSASRWDKNFEYNTPGRQGGTVSPILYTDQNPPAGVIQINNPDSPGKLRLQPVSAHGYPNVSPNHNFTEAGNFAVEFDLNTGIDDDVSPSGDYWASVLIGTAAPNQYVADSDGFGVFFQNRDGYAVVDRSTFVRYELPGAGFPDGRLPIGEFHVRLEVTTANFQGSPATIRMYINGIEVRLGNGAGKEHVKATGFFGNWITLGASGNTAITRTEAFDNLSVTAYPCIQASQHQPFLIVGNNPDHIRVKLRPWMIQSQAVSVTLTSQNPAVALPTGGSGAAITLNFPAGSTTEQVVSVTGVAAGTTQFVLSTPDGVCVGSPLSVTVGGVAGSPVSLINPSFEADIFTIMPGYAGGGNGAITGWAGGSGINPVSGQNPFANNGQIPDGNQVAFMQGDGSLSQMIGGFTVSAPYYLRYRENARNSCCGALPGMKAMMDGLVIVDAHTVAAVGAANPYRVVTSAKFFAEHPVQTLSFVKSSPGGGDNTALIDLVEVIPVTGPFVRSYGPVGAGVPTDSHVTILLEDGMTTVNPSSIQLVLDGALVSPAIIKSGNLTTVQFNPPSLFVPLSHHLVSLTFGDNSPTPILGLREFVFDAGVFSSAPSAFFIEAEDFNFDGGVNVGGGQHLVAADTMPYAGGAYAGLGAVQGIDYFGTGEDDSNNYRAGESPNVGMTGSGDISRGSFDITTNFKVGWNGSGDWFNYTRNFGASGVYNVYARLASGGADMHTQLDEVTSGATTSTQTTTKLGTFDAPTTGGSDTFTFVPLKTPAGNLARIHLSGMRTLRWTMLPGNLDFNYLALIPADADPDITAQSGEQTAFIGESTTFTIAATGSGPLTYQWRKNGADLPGQTSNTLNLANVQPSDLGSYTVVVTGPGGSLESEPFTLALPSVSVVATDNFAMELGGNDAYFTISRTGSTSAPLTVSYTVGGTATMGTDYLPITPANTVPIGQVTIPAGQSSAIIAVKPIDDALVEGIETVILTLNASANYTTLTGSATIEILDDEDSSGRLLREVYRDIPGGSIADLVAALPKFPNSPDTVDSVTQFESANLGDDYGVRLSGLLTPPTDGNYTFYIAGDDNSELWLSTDEDPAHKVLIASEPQWNGFRQWINGSNQSSRGTPASNISSAIALLASRSYYVEALQKEGRGGDQVSVTWQKDGDSVPSKGSDPIPGSALTVRLPMALSALQPAAVVSGGTDFTLTVHGNGFLSGAVVVWNAGGTETELTPSNVTPRQLQASVPAALITSSADIRTALVTVRNPDLKVSNALSFTVGSAAVQEVDSGVVPAGGTVAVTTAPVEVNGQPPATSAGVSATLENIGGTEPITVTAATYSTNPNAGTLFDTGGGFVDLQVAGNVPLTASMTANFYYPTTVLDEASRVLLYFNNTDWVPVISSGNSAPVKDMTDNLDGTVSGGRFTVVFDNTSTPLITGLGGTVFASSTPAVAGDHTPPEPPTLTTITGQCSATVPTPTAQDDVTGPVKGKTGDPLVYTAPGTYTVQWTYTDANDNVSSPQYQTVVVLPMTFQGFNSPIGGADATGGSFADPLRTYKLGSTIPVKFSATCAGAPVLTGIHTLTLTKRSSQTDSDTAILITAMEAATTGNQFRLTGSEWHFNVDTKARGLTMGTYELTATLSDGSKHAVWIQLK